MKNNIEDLIKEAGYGIAVHYNELNDLFEVYKIGSYFPGHSNTEEAIVSKDKSLIEALLNYLKIKEE